jgi:protein-L-isoaspartate(D-aspartate) O-methyltransferase
MASRPAWIELQLRARGIRDERVLAAMEQVQRECFLPASLRGRAYDDCALPLGCGQTVSQPYIVAFMCQELALAGDERVLDVGTGSGYAAAVLSELVCEVNTIERIPALAGRARATLERAGYSAVSVHVGDGSFGLPDRAPFDAIAVSAASPLVPHALWEQLAPQGRIAIPITEDRWRQNLCVFRRSPDGPRLLASLPARFVPLVF